MIEHNYYSAELKENLKACPCCKGTQWEQFSSMPYSHGNLNYQICSTCGLIFQSPQMSDEQRTAFYAENYRVFAFGQAIPPKIDLDIQINRAEHLVKIVREKHMNFKNLEGENHLDIGCGSGALIRRFQEVFGCNGTGIEPDESYRKFAQSQGLNIYSSLEEWKNNTQKKADIVTLSHVLEHLPDPLTFLINIKEDILNTNGILLIEVPNLYFHPYFDLAHILAFSPHTIRQILRMAGFKILYFKQHGHPTRITPRYMAVLAESVPFNLQSKITIQSEPTGIKIKRGIGLSLDNIETNLLRLIKRGRNLARRLRIIRA